MRYYKVFIDGKMKMCIWQLSKEFFVIIEIIVVYLLFGGKIVKMVLNLDYYYNNYNEDGNFKIVGKCLL